MIRLRDALVRLADDLENLDRRWALIGGMAVSARAEPRTTEDLDASLVVDSDREAESLSRDLMARGYRMATPPLEQVEVDRMAMVRLIAPGQRTEVIVDLFFASSGIEAEVVDAATVLEILPGVSLPVASLAHLLALKVLAGRLKDLADIDSLLRYAESRDIQQAREALELITSRGFHREKDLLAEFSRLVDG